MVLTKPELIAALQNEVRILLHLAGKVDRLKLDYRPTAKQRSTIELLRYLSMMGPTLVRYTLADAPDPALWAKEEQVANARDLDQAIAAIASHPDTYAALLQDVPESRLRDEVPALDGGKTSRGATLVTGVLASCTAYRTQLFLYLKASGREELNTMNLWAGIDAPMAV
jgi:hypothetical protein